ncbi:hypothetical protein SNEBB_005098 [Seison nebaliae]|nr:hypothetical protein SNEBB_005098 [Seison nebaliae]
MSGNLQLELEVDELLLEYFNYYLKSPSLPIVVEYDKVKNNIQLTTNTTLSSEITICQYEEQKLTELLNGLSNSTNVTRSHFPLPHFLRLDGQKPQTNSTNNQVTSVDIEYRNSNLFEWLNCERFNFFIKTELYREYLLCQNLLAPTTKPKCYSTSARLNNDTYRQLSSRLLGGRSYTELSFTTDLIDKQTTSRTKGLHSNNKNKTKSAIIDRENDDRRVKSNSSSFISWTKFQHKYTKSKNIPWTILMKEINPSNESNENYQMDVEASKKNLQRKILEENHEKFIGNLNGMKRFVKYLRNTSGIYLYQFWMDVEFFKQTMKIFDDIPQMPSRARDLRRIFFLFSHVFDEKTWNALTEFFQENNYEIRHNILNDVQYNILRRLRSYWVPRFILNEMTSKEFESINFAHQINLVLEDFDKKMIEPISTIIHDDQMELFDDIDIFKNENKTQFSNRLPQYFINMAICGDMDYGAPFLEYVCLQHSDKCMAILLFWMDTIRLYKDWYRLSDDVRLEQCWAMYHTYLDIRSNLYLNFDLNENHKIRNLLMNVKENKKTDISQRFDEKRRSLISKYSEGKYQSIDNTVKFSKTNSRRPSLTITREIQKNDDYEEKVNERRVREEQLKRSMDKCGDIEENKNVLDINIFSYYRNTILLPIVKMLWLNYVKYDIIKYRIAVINSCIRLLKNYGNKVFANKNESEGEKNGEMFSIQDNKLRELIVQTLQPQLRYERQQLILNCDSMESLMEYAEELISIDHPVVTTVVTNNSKKVKLSEGKIEKKRRLTEDERLERKKFYEFMDKQRKKTVRAVLSRQNADRNKAKLKKLAERKNQEKNDDNSETIREEIEETIDEEMVELNRRKKIEQKFDSYLSNDGLFQLMVNEFSKNKQRQTFVPPLQFVKQTNQLTNSKLKNKKQKFSKLSTTFLSGKAASRLKMILDKKEQIVFGEHLKQAQLSMQPAFIQLSNLLRDKVTPVFEDFYSDEANRTGNDGENFRKFLDLSTDELINKYTESGIPIFNENDKQTDNEDAFDVNIIIEPCTNGKKTPNDLDKKNFVSLLETVATGGINLKQKITSSFDLSMMTDNKEITEERKTLFRNYQHQYSHYLAFLSNICGEVIHKKNTGNSSNASQQQQQQQQIAQSIVNQSRRQSTLTSNDSLTVNGTKEFGIDIPYGRQLFEALPILKKRSPYGHKMERILGINGIEPMQQEVAETKLMVPNHLDDLAKALTAKGKNISSTLKKKDPEIELIFPSINCSIRNSNNENLPWLDNDLKFYVELLRFKEICHPKSNVELNRAKALYLIDSFLNCKVFIPPAMQLDIPVDIGNRLIKNLEKYSNQLHSGEHTSSTTGIGSSSTSAVQPRSSKGGRNTPSARMGGNSAQVPCPMCLNKDQLQVIDDCLLHILTLLLPYYSCFHQYYRKDYNRFYDNKYAVTKRQGRILQRYKFYDTDDQQPLEYSIDDLRININDKSVPVANLPLPDKKRSDSRQKDQNKYSNAPLKMTLLSDPNSLPPIMESPRPSNTSKQASRNNASINLHFSLVSGLTVKKANTQSFTNQNNMEIKT